MDDCVLLQVAHFIYFFQSERILSFIPPDGNLRLMSYHIGSQSVVAIPIYVRHNVNFKEGRLDITVGPKQTIGRTVRYIFLKVITFLHYN